MLFRSRDLESQAQNRSFHVVERTRTSAKCFENVKCRCKTIVFHRQICKFVTYLLPSSSKFASKLPNIFNLHRDGTPLI